MYEDDAGGGTPAQSCDPNEMDGPLGAGDPDTERFVKPGEWMDYTVYFENKSNADVPAQEVFVDAQLSEWLDWSTFEMGEVAFNNQNETVLAGLKNGLRTVAQNGADCKVQLSVEFDETTGAARWYLRSYDPSQSDYNYWPAAVDAGFLPPNDETHRGEGHITYRVKVRGDAPAGARIDASATIVFDQNEPIPTDPAWWNTVAQVRGVKVTVDGVETTLDLIVGQPYGELPDPGASPDGRPFVGWFTGSNGTGRQVTAATVVQPGDSALYPFWADMPYRTAAAVYDGYLADDAGRIVGSVQVKVAKGKVDRKSGAFSAKVTATVQLADGSKKISFKSGVADEKGAIKGLAAVGHSLEDISAGVDGLGGTFDGKYRIDGARNVFGAKSGDDATAASAALKACMGVRNVAWPEGALTVTVDKKGKAKVSGAAKGAKVSATSQLLVGRDGYLVPVVLAKSAPMSFNVLISKDGASTTVAGLDGAVAGKPGTLATGAAFGVGPGAAVLAPALAEAGAGKLYGAYLPSGVSVAAGKKWVVAGGAKGKVAFEKGSTEVIDTAKLTDNPSALKLAYKAKDGTFSGSFKAYCRVEGKKPKIKAYTVTVTGVMVGEKGYGMATLKKPFCSFPVSVE